MDAVLRATRVYEEKYGAQKANFFQSGTDRLLRTFERRMLKPCRSETNFPKSYLTQDYTSVYEDQGKLKKFLTTLTEDEKNFGKDGTDLLLQKRLEAYACTGRPFHTKNGKVYYVKDGYKLTNGIDANEDVALVPATQTKGRYATKYEATKWPKTVPMTLKNRDTIQTQYGDSKYLHVFINLAWDGFLTTPPPLETLQKIHDENHSFAWIKEVGEILRIRPQLEPSSLHDIANKVLEQNEQEASQRDAPAPAAPAPDARMDAIPIGIPLQDDVTSQVTDFISQPPRKEIWKEMWEEDKARGIALLKEEFEKLDQLGIYLKPHEKARAQIIAGGQIFAEITQKRKPQNVREIQASLTRFAQGMKTEDQYIQDLLGLLRAPSTYTIVNRNLNRGREAPPARYTLDANTLTNTKNRNDKYELTLDQAAELRRFGTLTINSSSFGMDYEDVITRD